MIFTETTIFTRKIIQLLTDDEYSDVQSQLALNPKIGDVIKGTGGLRKARFRGNGKGKSGGIRIIYLIVMENRILLIYAFAKNERSDLSPKQYMKLKEIAQGELK
jgi:mRNA-degrading endonuclease RelE of RelBE toxin-antitoxin system